LSGHAYLRAGLHPAPPFLSRGKGTVESIANCVRVETAFRKFFFDLVILVAPVLPQLPDVLIKRREGSEKLIFNGLVFSGLATLKDFSCGSILMGAGIVPFLVEIAVIG
jgi:hypothetical protein